MDLITAVWRWFWGLPQGWKIAAAVFFLSPLQSDLRRLYLWLARQPVRGVAWVGRKIAAATAIPRYELFRSQEYPIKLRWERKHSYDRGVLKRDLIIKYVGPEDGEVTLDAPEAWLWIEATRPGMTQGGSRMPKEKVSGHTGAWSPRPVHSGRDERGCVKFDLSRGPAAGIASFQHHKVSLRARVSYSGPGDQSGVVEAEPTQVPV